MNEEPKTNEEDWSVEPPKRDHRRLKTALRIALIVAALGAVALVGATLIVGHSILKQLQTPVGGLIIPNPHEEVVDNKTDCAVMAKRGAEYESGAEYGVSD